MPRDPHRTQEDSAEDKIDPHRSIYEKGNWAQKRKERARPNIMPLFNQLTEYRNWGVDMAREFKVLYTHPAGAIIDGAIANLLKSSESTDLDKGSSYSKKSKLSIKIKEYEKKLGEWGEGVLSNLYGENGRFISPHRSVAKHDGTFLLVNGGNCEIWIIQQ